MLWQCQSVLIIKQLKYVSYLTLCVGSVLCPVTVPIIHGMY
jgi:hypothetical protein